MTSCMECGNPWGVILDRGEEPTDERQRKAQAELVAMWLEQVECHHDEGTRFDTDRLPKCHAVEIVHVTEALAWFSSEQFGSYVDAGWWDAADCDIPGWLLKGRMRRWAYRWDCCDIGWSERYIAPVEEVVPA